MSSKVALESLSMDLLRVALGLHRGSAKMAERFAQEALKRKREVTPEDVRPYMRELLERLEKSLAKIDRHKRSEDALMYSTLIRNYCHMFLSQQP